MQRHSLLVKIGHLGSQGTASNQNPILHSLLMKLGLLGQDHIARPVPPQQQSLNLLMEARLGIGAEIAKGSAKTVQEVFSGCTD